MLDPPPPRRPEPCSLGMSRRFEPYIGPGLLILGVSLLVVHHGAGVSLDGEIRRPASVSGSRRRAHPIGLFRRQVPRRLRSCRFCGCTFRACRRHSSGLVLCMVSAGFHQRGGLRPVLCFRCCGVAGEADPCAAGRSRCVAGVAAACAGRRPLRCGVCGSCVLPLFHRGRFGSGEGRGVGCGVLGVVNRRRGTGGSIRGFGRRYIGSRFALAEQASSPPPLPAGPLLPDGPRFAAELRLHGPGPILKPPTTGFPIQPDPGSAVLPGQSLPPSRRLPRCRRLPLPAPSPLPAVAAVPNEDGPVPLCCAPAAGTSSARVDVPAGSSAVVGAAGSAGRPNPAALAIPEVPAASAEAAALPPESAPSARIPPSARVLSACPVAARASADFLAFSRHQTTPASTTSRMIKKTASMAIPSVGSASSFARRYVGSTSLSSTLTCRDFLFCAHCLAGRSGRSEGWDARGRARTIEGDAGHKRPMDDPRASQYSR
jgi:hypothetical protein